jgi:hypothetical protein
MDTKECCKGQAPIHQALESDRSLNCASGSNYSDVGGHPVRSRPDQIRNVNSFIIDATRMASRCRRALVSARFSWNQRIGAVIDVTEPVNEFGIADSYEIQRHKGTETFTDRAFYS